MNFKRGFGCFGYGVVVVDRYEIFFFSSLKYCDVDVVGFGMVFDLLLYYFFVNFICYLF